MDLKIPHITRALDLGDYAEELRGILIQVWVNCPRSFRERYWELIGETQKAMEAIHLNSDGDNIKTINDAAAKLCEWVAELWPGWTAEQVSDLANSDTDPALYPWALNRSWALIDEHRDRSKKK